MARTNYTLDVIVNQIPLTGMVPPQGTGVPVQNAVTSKFDAFVNFKVTSTADGGVYTYPTSPTVGVTGVNTTGSVNTPVPYPTTFTGSWSVSDPSALQIVSQTAATAQVKGIAAVTYDVPLGNLIYTCTVDGNVMTKTIPCKSNYDIVTGINDPLSVMQWTTASYCKATINNQQLDGVYQSSWPVSITQGNISRTITATWNANQGQSLYPQIIQMGSAPVLGSLIASGGTASFSAYFNDNIDNPYTVGFLICDASPNVADVSTASASVSGGVVTITWSDSVSNETGYQIYRYNKTTNALATVITGYTANQTSQTVSPGSGQHIFYVRAWNSYGYGKFKATNYVTI